jgi:preprotein translocase subunit SecE
MAEDRKKTMAEEADEREIERAAEERPAPRPAGPVGPNVAFNRAARAWTVLAAFFLGAGVYFIPLGFLQQPLGGLTIGSRPVPVAILGALAVFGAALWAAVRHVFPRLDWIKPGQGRWVRVVTYAGFGFMAIFGAATFHNLPGLRSAWYAVLWEMSLAGLPITLRPIFFPSAALAMIAILAFHLFMNRPRWTDFLIETQSEVRRVSWPARREWVGSSIVVMIVIAVISVFLALVDKGLSKVLQSLKIGF